MTRLLIRLPGVDGEGARDVTRQVAAWAATRPHVTATVRASDPPATYAQVEVVNLDDDDLLALAPLLEAYTWPDLPQAQLVVDPAPLAA